jgi:hypothetical protein
MASIGEVFLSRINSLSNPTRNSTPIDVASLENKGSTFNIERR